MGGNEGRNGRYKKELNGTAKHEKYIKLKTKQYSGINILDAAE